VAATLRGGCVLTPPVTDLAHVEWVRQLCDLTKAGERLAAAVRQAFDAPRSDGVRDELEAALAAYEAEHAKHD